MNQIRAALANCQSFLQDDIAVLEKGQVLKTTTVDAGSPLPCPGDAKATKMDSKLHYNTFPIQKCTAFAWGPLSLPFQYNLCTERLLVLKYLCLKYIDNENKLSVCSLIIR